MLLILLLGISLIISQDFYLNLIGFDKNNLFNTKLFNYRKNSNFEEIHNMNKSFKFMSKENGDLFFVILIASYNNIKYYEKNIKSVLDQNYQNYIAIYMDDISTDGTAEAVEEYLSINDLSNHFILIKNNEKKYCLKNYVDSINSFCLDSAIIITLDGDDLLFQNDALEVLNNIYKDGKTWITTGDPLCFSSRLKHSAYHDLYCNGLGLKNSWKNPYDKDLFEIGIRKSRIWCFFHLRTFYTSLFLKINNKDFLDSNGEYFKHTEDLAFMLPMLEMSGLEHYKFISDPILYFYNDTNVIRSGNVWNTLRLTSTFNFIFSKKSYSKLDKLEV